MYINNIDKINYDDIPYFIDMKTISYSKNTLENIFQSVETRRELYFDGIKQGEAFIKKLNKE